jgi:hypothetical protein
VTAPDGIGIHPDVWPVIAATREKCGEQMIHLRLRPDPASYPVTGCRVGIGQWWTGKASEVTCPACLELVHS